jgi:hypothetical protein
MHKCGKARTRVMSVMEKVKGPKAWCGEQRAGGVQRIHATWVRGDLIRMQPGKGKDVAGRLGRQCRLGTMRIKCHGVLPGTVSVASSWLAVWGFGSCVCGVRVLGQELEGVAWCVHVVCVLEVWTACRRECAPRIMVIR